MMISRGKRPIVFKGKILSNYGKENLQGMIHTKLLKLRLPNLHVVHILLMPSKVNIFRVQGHRGLENPGRQNTDQEVNPTNKCFPLIIKSEGHI
jgi:hypothetical protein